MHYPVKIYQHCYDNIVKLYVECIDKCNYACKYCYNTRCHNRTNKELDLQKVASFADWLTNKTSKQVQIVLIGGEPTLHSQFNQIIDISSKHKLLSFSNFSLPYDFFAKTIRRGMTYFLSFHYNSSQRTRDFVDKLGMLDSEHLLDAVDTVCIMAPPEHFDICMQIYDQLFSKYGGNKIACSLIDDCDKAVVMKHRQQLYTDKQLSDFYTRSMQSDQDKDFIVTYNDGCVEHISDYEYKQRIDFNFKFWKCNAGKSYFSIDVDGNIYPCSQMKCQKIATLDEYQHLQLKPTVCRSTECPCDYGLEKQRIFS